MPHHNKNQSNKPNDKVGKVAMGLANNAMQARVFDVPGFDRPDAVADYCIAIARRIIEADAIDDNTP